MHCQVSILLDGEPVSLSPIFPYVFTGGIDPYLWKPNPGVQTLHMLPLRLDLSPLAPLLNDNQVHQFEISNGPSLVIKTAANSQLV